MAPILDTVSSLEPLLVPFWMLLVPSWSIWGRNHTNLADVADLVPAVDANLEAQWDIYKSVVQPPGRRQSTPKRMTRKKFEDSVYHLADCCARVGGEDTEPAEDVLIPDNFGDGADAVAAPIGNMDLLFGLKYVKKRFRNL